MRRPMSLHAALVSGLFALICSRDAASQSSGRPRQPPTDAHTARVHITASGSAFVVSLERGGATLATWTAATIDRALGERVERWLASAPRDGVIFCGPPDASVTQLQTAASGLGRGRETVVCMPNRRNCPDTCP